MHSSHFLAFPRLGLRNVPLEPSGASRGIPWDRPWDEQPCDYPKNLMVVKTTISFFRKVFLMTLAGKKEINTKQTGCWIIFQFFSMMFHHPVVLFYSKDDYNMASSWFQICNDAMFLTMLIKTCWPPMVGNGLHELHGDDWGMVNFSLNHISYNKKITSSWVW